MTQQEGTTINEGMGEAVKDWMLTLTVGRAIERRGVSKYPFTMASETNQLIPTGKGMKPCRGSNTQTGVRLIAHDHHQVMMTGSKVIHKTVITYRT